MGLSVKQPVCKAKEKRAWGVGGASGGWGVVAHAFNPSTWEAEAGRFLTLRSAWSTA